MNENDEEERVNSEPILKEIPLVNCHDYHDYLEQNYGMDDFGEDLDEYLCPNIDVFKENKFVSGGDAKAFIREATTLDIKACTGDNCDKKAIGELVRKIDVQLVFINANFDPKSIENPINFYYDSKLNEQIVSDISKNFMINVMSQKAELVDDYLGQSKKTYRFF